MSDRKLVLERKIKLRKDDVVDQVHYWDLDLAKNHIYLFGIESYNDANGMDSFEPGVEYIMANRFIRNMNLCMGANPSMPIVVHMKSNGGYYEEGMAIYDTIKFCPVPVTILNYTHARSMTSIILQAANKRVTMPSGYFLFHDGDISVSGTVKQVRSAVEFEKRSTETMYNIYIESMREKGFLKNDSERKRWLKTKMD